MPPTSFYPRLPLRPAPRPASVLIGVAVTLTLALTACARDGGSSTAMPATATVGTTSSPIIAPAPGVTTEPNTTTSPSAPVPSSARPTPDAGPGRVPPEARAHTEAGAQQFVRFFIDQVNHAWMTPDPSRLDGLFLASCKTCTALHADAENFVRIGQRVASPPMRVSAVSTEATSLSGTAIRVSIDQVAVDIVDGAGTKVDSIPASPADLVATLAFDDGRWQVAELQSAPR